MKKNTKIVLALGLTASVTASMLWTSQGLSTITYADETSVSKESSAADEASCENSTSESNISKDEDKGDIEYILCDKNGNQKTYIVKDEEKNKLNYMDSDSSFPIKTSITYEMDGKEVSKEDVENKSGDITLKCTYEASGSGENYSVVTLMVFDEDKFDNISVEGGKIISDGSKSVVVAFGMMPEDITVTTKAKEFDIEMMYAMATNSLLGDINLDDLNLGSLLGIDVDKLKETLGSLKDAGDKFEGGSVSLLDGVSELSNGLDQLSTGLNTLDSNSAQLNNGARQVFQSLIDMANSKIKESGVSLPTLTIENYSEVLNGAISKASKEGVISTARSTVESKVRLNKDKISAEVTKAVIAEVQSKVEAATRQTIMEAVLASQGMTLEQYTEALKAGMVTSDKVDAAVNAKMQDPAITAKMQATVDEKLASSEVQALIHEKIEEQISKITNENMNSAEVQTQIQAGIAKGSQGAKQLQELKNQLDSYNKFYRGLKTYTDGVAKAADGAATINEATSAFTGSMDSILDDDTLSLIDDADEILDKTKDLGNKKSIKYIFKFD